MAAYQQPPWAQGPKEVWSLLEIKQGVELARHDLRAACTTIGRQGDIESLHASLSRFHARIAFDASGTPWLRDLQSAHGVTVNKKPLPPASIGKDESTSQKAGSRGVVVYPGDLIQLGASTRIYCVDGPASYERGRIRRVAAPPKAPLRQQQHPVEEEEAPHVLSDETVPSQYQKEWDRVKALRYKRENLETESGRIRAKTDMAELTEGQERQLERNDTRQQQIQTQIDEAEDALWAKVFGKTDQQRARRSAEHNDHDDDEVDDFYDRTNSDDQRESGASEDQTEESLLKQWDELCLQRRTIRQKVQFAHDALETARDRLATAEEEFFAQNDLDIAIDAHKRVKSKLQSVDGRLDEIENLMHIVNPKRKLKDATAVVEKPSRQTSIAVPMPSNISKPSINPQHSVAPAPQKETIPPPTMLLPPPKRSKTVPEPSQPKFMLPPPPRKRPVPGAVIGPSKNPTDMPEEGNRGESSSLFDTWQAPSDQDGSGRTKLNEKFGGRY